MSNVRVIGERLRKLRGEMKRETVCDACGISVSALCLYETGKRVPRDEVKVKLASFFNTSVESIFFT